MNYFIQTKTDRCIGAFGKKMLIIFGVLCIAATSCKKSDKVGNDNPDTGTHHVDPRLVGKWMWSEGSDGAYYDDNGVYNGSAYGLAIQYEVNADGSGRGFDHVFSTIGTGTDLEVNISSKGYFETDDQGHLGYFPLSGTYKSSSGENRPLNSAEVWNSKTNTGFSMLYQKVTFTTQGGRECFQVTSSDDVTDTFFKVP